MSRRKSIFLTVLVLLQLALIWPVYPLFSDIHPMILGLPLSFAWVIFVLICSFLLLVWYYLNDPNLKTGQNE